MQEVEVRTVVRLPLEQFERGDLPVGLPVAPPRRQGSPHRRPVLLEPAGEPFLVPLDT